MGGVWGQSGRRPQNSVHSGLVDRGMDDGTRDPLPAPEQGQLLTGAYWLDSPAHVGDECAWCTQLEREGVVPDQRFGVQAE